MTLELASRYDRAVAKSLDGLFAALPILLIALAYFPNVPVEARGPATTLGGAAFFLLMFWQVWLLSTAGQTLGKRMLKIRIVRQGTADAPGFGRGVALRAWANALLGAIPFYSLVDAALIFRDDQRCLHDHLAGTDVVKVGAPAQ